MSTARICLVPTIVLLAALLQGCSTTPRFNEHFGAAVRANLAAQAIDPAAAASTNPAAGIDGAAARSSHERYLRSFKDVEPTMDKSLVGAGSAK